MRTQTPEHHELTSHISFLVKESKTRRVTEEKTCGQVCHQEAKKNKTEWGKEEQKSGISTQNIWEILEWCAMWCLPSLHSLHFFIIFNFWIVTLHKDWNPMCTAARGLKKNKSVELLLTPKRNKQGKNQLNNHQLQIFKNSQFLYRKWFSRKQSYFKK